MVLIAGTSRRCPGPERLVSRGKRLLRRQVADDREQAVVRHEPGFVEGDEVVARDAA